MAPFEVGTFPHLLMQMESMVMTYVNTDPEPATEIFYDFSDRQALERQAAGAMLMYDGLSSTQMYASPSRARSRSTR